MSLTPEDLYAISEMVTDAVNDAFNARAATAPPEPPRSVNVGEDYSFKADAEKFLARRNVTEYGPHLFELMNGHWPTRLLYLPRDAEPSTDDLVLLYHNADLIDADPHAMMRLALLSGYPLMRLQELDGMTNPDVMVVCPINRNVARHAGAVTRDYARDKAKRWAYTVTNTAWQRDQEAAALAAAPEVDH